MNPALAKHYGMPVAKDLPRDAWVRVDDADRYQRGGILPMAVFLTKNAPGLRTSPVKRGYWVVRRALGEVIPAPPAQVPDLPNDESKMGKLTLRQALEQHRKDPSCAGCHARFDSFGLVFEGYGPVGELRNKDLGGRPVDVRAPFPGGQEVAGLDGLRGYLKAHRQDDFVRQPDGEAAQLRPGTHPAAVGRSLHRRDPGGPGRRRFPFRDPGRAHRDQPPVPEQARTR